MTVDFKFERFKNLDNYINILNEFIVSGWNFQLNLILIYIIFDIYSIYFKVLTFRIRLIII